MDKLVICLYVFREKEFKQVGEKFTIDCREWPCSRFLSASEQCRTGDTRPGPLPL